MAATRRRFVMVGGGALALAAVVAIVIAVFSSGGGEPASSTHGNGAGLTSTVVLRLPAASAVVRGDGGAWVTDDLRNRLYRFDPSTGKTGASVPLAGRPVAMVLTGTHLWVAEMVSNTVEEFSAPTLRHLRTIQVATGPSGLAEEGGHILVVSLIAGTLTPIDEVTGQQGASLTIPGGAVRVATCDHTAWITGTADVLTPVNLNVSGNGALYPTIRIGAVPIGVTCGAGSVWATDASDGVVTRINPVTRAVVHTYRIGGDPVAVVASTGRVLVADGTGQSVREIYPAVEKALGLRTTPRSFFDVPGGVWVATANPGRVLEVQTAS